MSVRSKGASERHEAREREIWASSLPVLPNSRGIIHFVILFSLAHSLPMEMEQCLLGRLVVWLFRSVPA